MIRSMTAYAEQQTTRDGFTVSAEIRSYNSRYLDVSLRLPPRYRHFESNIKQLISQYIQRGRVEVNLYVRDERPGHTGAYQVDTGRAREFVEALKKLQAELRLDGVISLDQVARAEGIITALEPESPGDFEWACVSETMTRTLTALNEMRDREGAFLAADLAGRLDGLDGVVAFVRAQSADLLAEACARIKERVTALIGDMVEIDQVRLAQEAAFYVDKADISEEIVRAESHIAQFRQAMADNQPCGRKLNFLLQEFNREFNTMGSKTCHPAVSERVVTAKVELEKLREQVQNVE